MKSLFLVNAIFNLKNYVNEKEALNSILKSYPNVMFSSRVNLISVNHDFKNREEHQKEKLIIIADNFWLGANIIVLQGITIGVNVIIGVINFEAKNIEVTSIYAGNPAKKLREI